MSVDTRASEAAEALRKAVTVDTEAGLNALVATHHRRRATGMVLAVAGAVLAVAAGQALLSTTPEDQNEPAGRLSSGIVFDMTPAEGAPARLGVVREDGVEVLSGDGEVIDPVAMAVSPAGTALALVDGASRLQVLEPQTSELWTTECRECVEVTWTPKHRVMTRGVDDTGAAVTLIHRPSDDSRPQEVRLPTEAPLSGLSPGGDQVVTVHQVGELQRLALTQRVSGETVPLPATTTQPGETIAEVRWSPNGAQLAYVVSRVSLTDPTTREYRLDSVLSDGSWGNVLADLGRCACTSAQAPGFAWSRDGMEVAAVVASHDGRTDRFRVATVGIVEVGALPSSKRHEALREVAPSGGSPVAWWQDPS